LSYKRDLTIYKKNNSIYGKGKSIRKSDEGENISRKTMTQIWLLDP
jgi:hypothetical protein